MAVWKSEAQQRPLEELNEVMIGASFGTDFLDQIPKNPKPEKCLVRKQIYGATAVVETDCSSTACSLCSIPRSRMTQHLRGNHLDKKILSRYFINDFLSSAVYQWSIL